MAFPYTWAFLVLLGAYLLYSRWAGWDAKYLIVAAVLLLLASAIAEAELEFVLANTIVVYALFLFAGGVLLLALDLPKAPLAETASARAAAAATAPPPVESSGERQPSPEHPLDGLEQ